MADQKYERFNEAVLSRLLLETKQSAAAAVERAAELLAEREQEVEQLRADLAVERHENALWEGIADELETRLVECQRLLREAVSMRLRCDGLPEEWFERAEKAGGEDVDMPTT